MLVSWEVAPASCEVYWEPLNFGAKGGEKEGAKRGKSPCPAWHQLLGQQEKSFEKSECCPLGKGQVLKDNLSFSWCWCGLVGVGHTDASGKPKTCTCL